ncbi:MAG TPA: hypothetical protein VF450_04155 [Noviherbaspirillum sp.]
MKTVNVISDRFALAGKAVELLGYGGEIIANQRWSESKTSWAGLGSVNRATGELRLPELLSQTTEQQEFWLRLKSGQDVQCRYSGRTIPVTSGQRVTVITLSSGSVGMNVALVNHSTGYWHPMADLNWCVHACLFRSSSWLGTFVLAVAGWMAIGFAAAFCFTAGAPTMKAFIRSQPVQAFFGILIAALPTPPGAHDRGETLVLVIALFGFFLLVAPPLYALVRHRRRNTRFREIVDALTEHINQLAQRAL